MNGRPKLPRGRQILHRTMTVVAHLVDDVEPDRLSSVAPMGADGLRVKPFSQNR
jgi:hypothetical protein